MPDKQLLDFNIIATDCMTGPKEILEDKYGILVPNMSPDLNLDEKVITEEEKKLSERIVKLLENPEEMERYGQLSLQRAGNYSKESYIDKINEWARD